MIEDNVDKPRWLLTVNDGDMHDKRIDKRRPDRRARRQWQRLQLSLRFLDHREMPIAAVAQKLPAGHLDTSLLQAHSRCQRAGQSCNLAHGYLQRVLRQLIDILSVDRCGALLIGDVLLRQTTRR
ncbi:hypothetical protein D3C81_1357600 [compost metagenome]